MNCNEQKNDGVSDAMRSFMLTYKMHRSLIKNSVDKLGIARSAHRILMYICISEKPVCQKHIASEFEISAAAVANIIKKLESEGYIERHSAGNDSRFNELYPTEKGRDIAISSKNIFDNIDKALFSDFSEDDIRIFIKYNEKLQENLKSIDILTLTQGENMEVKQ